MDNLRTGTGRWTQVFSGGAGRVLPALDGAARLTRLCLGGVPAPARTLLTFTRAWARERPSIAAAVAELERIAPGTVA